jgi:hypothetical protein
MQYGKLPATTRFVAIFARYETCRWGRPMRIARFPEFLRGRALTFVSELPPDEVASLVMLHSKWVFSQTATGVIGWARHGILWLRNRRGSSRSVFSPILAGWILPHGDGGTLLRLSFRPPYLTQILFPLWYVALLVAAFTWVGGAWERGDDLVALIVGSGLAVAAYVPASFLNDGLYYSDSDFGVLCRFLETNVQARLIALV